MFSKRSLEGELIIDHKAGAGISVEEARKFGCVPCPSGTRVELPVATCAHCQAGVIMNPNRTRDRAWCSICDRYLCDNCNLRRQLSFYVHESFQAFADRYIQSAYRRQQWQNA